MNFCRINSISLVCECLIFHIDELSRSRFMFMFVSLARNDCFQQWLFVSSLLFPFSSLLLQND